MTVEFLVYLATWNPPKQKTVCRPILRQEVTRRWRPLRLRLAWLTNAVLRRMMLRAWRKVSGVEQQLRLLLNYCDHRCTRSLLFRVFHHWRALRDTKLGCMASLIYKEERRCFFLEFMYIQVIFRQHSCKWKSTNLETEYIFKEGGSFPLS